MTKNNDYMIMADLTDQINDTNIFNLPQDGDYSKLFNIFVNGQMLLIDENYTIKDYTLTLLTTTLTNEDRIILQFYPNDKYSVCLNDLIEAVIRQGRFNTLDTAICPLSRDEIIDAIYNAIDDVNSYPPQTGFTLDDICTLKDTRWKRLVILRATGNCIDNLLFQWTADGVDITVGEFAIQDKTSAYNTLSDMINNKFNEMLEKLKIASQNFSSSRVYNTSGQWGYFSSKFMFDTYNNSRISRGRW